MQEIDIYWGDLTEDCQEQIKEMLGDDVAKENNWEVIPMTTITYYED